MNTIEEANKYIKENKGKVSSRPYYHFTPPVGWMNDPNGFCYFDNKYHLFYQYYPYGVFWGDMHWGYAISEDLINWKHMPVVMANDKPYDLNGCFSGSAIEMNGELYLMYTGNITCESKDGTNQGGTIQQQCLAKYHSDGTVEKLDEVNPVITKYELPDKYEVRDFRDPKVYSQEGVFYVVLAARNDEGRGSILLYRSVDLIEWEFVSDIYRRPLGDNTLFECPDLFNVDGKDVLILSVMPCDEEYKGVVNNEVQYIVGKMDYSNGLFIEESRGILDHGSSFYAPQTTEDKSGNRVVIGWASTWSSQSNTKAEEFGYNGIMTIPRKISYIEERLIQTPVDCIANYKNMILSITGMSLNGEMFFENTTSKQHVSIMVSDFQSSFSFSIQNNSENLYIFVFDSTSNMLSIKSCYQSIDDIDTEFDYMGAAVIDIFIDNHIVEVFINGVPFTFRCCDFEVFDRMILNSFSEITINQIVQNEISGVDIV